MGESAGRGIAFGFDVHNGGLVPMTVLDVTLCDFDPGTVHVLAPAGAQLGPGFGQMAPWHRSPWAREARWTSDSPSA
jgi:hypothetical protein